jgi:hypothetical protein
VLPCYWSFRWFFFPNSSKRTTAESSRLQFWDRIFPLSLLTPYEDTSTRSTHRAGLGDVLDFLGPLVRMTCFGN